MFDRAAYMRAWRAKNPEETRARAREHSRTYRERNPDKVREMNRKYDLAYRLTGDGQEKRRAQMRRRYQLKREEEMARVAKWRASDRGRAFSHGVDPATIHPRPDACEVCGVTPKKTLHFDHDHATGKFRGWLCHNCNVALGHCRDDRKILMALVDYLKRTS